MALFNADFPFFFEYTGTSFYLTGGRDRENSTSQYLDGSYAFEVKPYPGRFVPNSDPGKLVLQEYRKSLVCRLYYEDNETPKDRKKYVGSPKGPYLSVKVNNKVEFIVTVEYGARPGTGNVAREPLKNIRWISVKDAIWEPEGSSSLWSCFVNVSQEDIEKNFYRIKISPFSEDIGPFRNTLYEAEIIETNVLDNGFFDPIPKNDFYRMVKAEVIFRDGGTKIQYRS